jgi:hypothetical protein
MEMKDLRIPLLHSAFFSFCRGNVRRKRVEGVLQIETRASHVQNTDRLHQ